VDNLRDALGKTLRLSPPCFASRDARYSLVEIAGGWQEGRMLRALLWDLAKSNLAISGEPTMQLN